MAAETLCPHCGHGPIADGAESCPKCGERFADRPNRKGGRRGGGGTYREDSDDAEVSRTALGAITGSVDAHPLPTAMVLVGSTFAWVLRCTQVLSDRPQPFWPLVLAGLQLVVAGMLVAPAGPARHLAQMVAVAQIAAGYFVGGGPVTTVGYVGVGVALLLMTAAEPGDVRRWLGTGAAIAMLGFGVWGVATGG